jgi:hypothetical protein
LTALTKRAARGVTLIELVIFMIIAVAIFITANLIYRPNDVKARYQAEQLRSDMRHMQMLASSWGLMLRLATAAGSYSVRCASVTVAPCPALTTTPVTDPATGAQFLVTLQGGLALAGPTESAAAITLDFDALGRPRNAAGLIVNDAVMTVTAAGGAPVFTLNIKPLTGFGVVSP